MVRVTATFYYHESAIFDIYNKCNNYRIELISFIKFLFVNDSLRRTKQIDKTKMNSFLQFYRSALSKKFDNEGKGKSIYQFHKLAKHKT